jgi:hypothetical protein
MKAPARILKLLKDNPCPRSVSKEMEAEGYSAYPWHVFTKGKTIIKSCMFCGVIDNPPFPSCPTQIISSHNGETVWVIQPLCDLITADEYWGFMEKYGKYDGTEYDLHAGNVRKYKGKILAIDW